MSWATLSVAQVLAEGGFSSSEKSALDANAGAGAGTLSDTLTNVISTIRGIISATGGTLGSAGTIPDSLRMHAVALVRWRWLIAFPALRQYQTEERKQAAERAEAWLEKVAAGDLPVEAPEAGDYDGAGNYGGETKIAMRTSDGGASTLNED